MLSSIELQELQNIINRLESEGYDTTTIQTIIDKESIKVNNDEADKLLAYFNISPNIDIGMTKINYGFKKLVSHLTLYLEHQDGVFSIEDKPEKFERVLKMAILNCLKNLNIEYQKEVQKLKPSTTIRTASIENPFVLDFKITNNMLFVTSGSIDTKYVWRIVDIRDTMGISIIDTMNVVTATNELPLQVELTNGDINVILNATSGTVSNTSCKNDAVWILGGV